MNSMTYKAEIEDLLSNYVDGWDVFKKAKDWDSPVHIKPESAGKPIPTSWLELADKVISIIAHKKYGLDTYPNVIELIDSEQMLDAYSSIGMPVNYDHWSFGKHLIQQEKAYDAGRMGLAYEIVINSSPAIAYCMIHNTKTMQMLVIAHASYGHNSFFKNNYLFRQFTRANEIIGDLKRLKESVSKYEEKYGRDEVERILDACHALQSHAVSRIPKPPIHSPQEQAARRAMIEEARRKSFDLVMDTVLHRTSAEDFQKAANDDHLLPEPEENLLRYVAQYAPHLEDWQRDIVRQISNVSEYFYPQRQTQVMNEGWASFWHYTILNDVSDLKLIDPGMTMEFLESHSNVLHQPDFDDDYYSGGLNPYALGFAIYNDIKRICESPTDEDRQYFPHIAGKPWLPTLKFAMENHTDESFIQQYLSPTVIRDLHLFTLTDDDRDTMLEINAIHNEDGYRIIREDLASQYRLSDREPCIEVVGYDYKGDRSLTLRHKKFNRIPLETDNANLVLKHFYQLWRHPVILNSIEEDGKISKTLTMPPLPEKNATPTPKATW